MEHYYTKKPISELKPFYIDAKIDGNDIKIISANGLFSKDRIDKGSRLLIDNAQIKKDQTVLDLGCGYGIVGIMAHKMYNAKVTFSDVNERAVIVTKKNCKMHGIKPSVIHSDGFEKIEKMFDVILLNPPQTAGRQVCEKLIMQSAKHLNQKGSLQIVARHNKGGKTLSAYMNRYFDVKTLAKSGGFRVYSGRIL